MKVRIETVYENVDRKWLKWYLKRLRTEGGLPIVAEELEECGHAVYASKDPTSDVMATSTYEVVE